VRVDIIKCLIVFVMSLLHYISNYNRSKSRLGAKPLVCFYNLFPDLCRLAMFALLNDGLEQISYAVLMHHQRCQQSMHYTDVIKLLMNYS